ncbi:MAG TPA: Nudix family hydrolase [Gammaproteobacteria bacterium]|nr:Nudix family hydrolase [Gammaproteobacteria bacterium]
MKIKTHQKNKKPIHVVAAVVENGKGEIFIAKRPAHSHQGGRWEFPGGKVEPGESAKQALARELFEETGIVVKKCRPLIQISHNYPDKSVFLDVWQVSDFDGEAHGKEGQETCWINKHRLDQFQFPAANKAIITAATLPQLYLITPQPDFQQRNTFLRNIENKVRDGIKLIQLRAKNLTPTQLDTLYHEAREICLTHGATLFINAPLAFANKISAEGVHLSSAELQATHHLPRTLLCAASCHSEQEIIKASKLGVTFIVVSPVLRTNCHPGAPPLNWEKFAVLCQSAPMPVYALGGMDQTHVEQAIANGAQGIAAIRSLWCSSKGL